MYGTHPYYQDYPSAVVDVPKGRRVPKPDNAVHVLYPKRSEFGTWYFTDPAANLDGEPFVGEINDMIDYLVKDIPNAKDGFILYFSDQPIKNHQMSFTLIEATPGRGGADYRCDQLNIEGWLCPALFCYFQDPPARLYARAEARRA